MVLDHELLVLDRELGYRCLSADRWGSTVNRLGPEPEIIKDPYLQSKGYRKLALEKHDYVFIYRVNGETFIRRDEREYIFKYSAKYLFCAILRLIFDILILHCRFVLRTRGQAVIMRYEVQAGCIMAFARRFHKNTGSIITFIRLAQMSYLTL